MAEVVVGIDGSPASQAAVRWALEDVARRGGGRLHVAYAWEYPIAAMAPSPVGTVVPPGDEMQSAATEALAQLSAILGLGHDGYQLRMLLARAESARGERQGALAQLDAAIALDPERHEAFALMAELAEQAGDAPRLTRALERWSFLEQHARAPLLPYLRLLEQRGDYQGLRVRAEAGLYLDPEQSELHRLYALALVYTGHAEQARAEAERAVNLARTPAEQGRDLSARELVLRAARPGKVPRK